jgi:pyruvate dehydrogenase E1 component alpha subunit
MRKINNKKRLSLYFDLLSIRKTELAIAKEYKNQEIRCPVHLSIGQEAVAVGICKNLKKTDQIVTSHRSHAHYLSKGGKLKPMISELYGKVTGVAQGKGGSMHLIDIEAGVMAAVPIVGSAIPIGVGLAWANKINNLNKIVVVFFGDAASEEGVFLESLDFASLKNLKILFVCENNFYSTYSFIENRQYHKKRIIDIAKATGIKAVSAEGNNVEKNYLLAKNIIKKIKIQSRPYLIELKTFRQLEHCGPGNDDHLNYRREGFVNYWFKKCPIKFYENYLLKNKIISKKKNIFIKKKLDLNIENAFKYAKKSKFPNKSFLKKNIYA